MEREDPLFGILTQFHTTLKVHSITAFQFDSVPHTVTCGFQFGGILWSVIFQNIFRKQHKVVVKLIFCQVRALLTLTFSITTTSLNENYFNRHTHTYPHTCICTHVTSYMEPCLALPSFMAVSNAHGVPSLQPWCSGSLLGIALLGTWKTALHKTK